ncbi:MAG: hypothetical protein EA389_06050 [Ilumatobacter sp.]|nr:MAG: hypothetical protein EA389_06050 [Ilumatobacter sp.]
MSDDAAGDASDEIESPTVGAPQGLGPRWLPTVLVVFATLLAVVGATTTWLKVQMLDTDRWVAVSSDLLEEPEVRSALSSYLGEQLFEAVDVRAELEGLLPPRAAGLAGPLTGLMRVSVANAVEQLLASDRFGDVWEGANRRTHTAAVAVLRGEDVGPLSTADGAITLELGEALQQLGARLGLPAGALDRIPPGFGQIIVADSDDLAAAQRAVQVAEFVSWMLLLAVVALYAGAIALAVGRRTAMVLQVGIALVVGGAVLLVARLLGVYLSVGAIVRKTENESVATVVGMVATQLLRNIAWTSIAIGLVIAVTAAILGAGLGSGGSGGSGGASRLAATPPPHDPQSQPDGRSE